MNAPAHLSQKDRLRARDGERCWLCDGKLSFGAAPNGKKAPTVEHLVARANGGTDALDNLVLTHSGCNKQLGCRPIEEKRQMREKYRAARERTGAARQVRADTPVEDGGNRGLRPRPAAPPPAARPLLKRALRQWQMTAALASGAALLSFGFAAGVLLGR